jgi:hypothetical protein
MQLLREINVDSRQLTAVRRRHDAVGTVLGQAVRALSGLDRELIHNPVGDLRGGPRGLQDGVIRAKRTP